MKSMTCKQLGGPCDLVFYGDTADEIIKAQDRHLKVAVQSGDPAHQEARDAMKGRWKNPIKGMGWYCDTKKAFNALPEDSAGESGRAKPTAPLIPIRGEPELTPVVDGPESPERGGRAKQRLTEGPLSAFEPRE